MILDTSAVVAIILKEKEAEAIGKLISKSKSVAISSATLVEVGIVLGNYLGFETTLVH